MAVKKSKKAPKKAVKKAVISKKKPAVKKVVKKAAKKAVKKPAKKPAKKAAKKTVAKKAHKSAKPAKKPVKKPVAKKAASKKTAPKKTAPKKVVTTTVAVKSVSKEVKKPVKPVAVAPAKKFMRAEKTQLMNEPEFSAVTMKALQSGPSKKATTLLGSLEFMPYQPKADEAYMSDHQKDHFRKILDAWKQQLMQDVDLTVGHLKEEAVFYADPVDRAAQEEGFNLELRTRDRERKLIKKIEQSLDLLNTNEYGYCEDCGAEIGIRRLEARPTAVKCIDCKTFQEIREKQLGG